MAYGRINKGKVKETPGQIKKHVSQMTKDEISFLTKKLRGIANLEIGWHLEEKFIDKDLERFKSVLKDKDLSKYIIEYNETPYKDSIDRRVLIRPTEEYLVDLGRYDAYCHLCIVYSFVHNRVVTAYYNKVNDHHRTLNPDRYSPDLEIIH